MDGSDTRLGRTELNDCKEKTFMRSDTFLFTELSKGTVLPGQTGVKHTTENSRTCFKSAHSAGHALSVAHPDARSLVATPLLSPAGDKRVIV